MRNWIKCSLLLALLCILLSTTGQAAESSGYIFRLTDNVSLLSVGDSSGIFQNAEEVYAPEGLFRTHDFALIQELSEKGLLAYAEPDWEVVLLDVPDDPGYLEGKQWELPMLHLEYAWSRGITGAQQDGTPVRVGLVDSGVCAEHEDLAGANIAPGVNYCVSADNDSRGDISDSLGHGTFVAGILAASTGNGVGIAGLAPQAEIVPLKCFTEKYGRISDVLAAIYGGVDDFHCQILNMSLGISQSGLNSSLQGNPRALDEAMAYAREKGVILVAAVGNVSGGSTGNDTVMFPAGYETVIGVGSVDKDKAVAVTSCQNESVFLAAPGDGLYGLGVSSNSSYITGSGTSFATPMVTAAAALALSVKPDLSQEEFMYLLRETAEDLGELGWDSAYGYGLLDIGKLLETIETGWYQFEENGQEVLAVNLEGLTPNSTVFLVQAIRNVMGAQMNVKITEKTASADGNLHCNLILEPIASDETRVLFTLNRHLCPLKSKYITTTCLAS